MAAAVEARPGAPVAKKKGPEKHRFEMQLDRALWLRIERQAERLTQSAASYIRQAVMTRLEEDERADPNRQG